MSVRALPDKKFWKTFQLPYNRIVGQLFSYNIFEWADAHRTIELGSEYRKWSYLNYYGGFEFGNLENPHRRRFVKLGDFNKITEKLALKGIFTHFGRFSNFCKIAYLWVKFDEKYTGEVAEPYSQPYLRYGQVLCKNGAQSTQKWSQLDYDDRFDNGELENLLVAWSFLRARFTPISPFKIKKRCAIFEI